MHHALQRVLEALSHLLQLAHGEVALLELPVHEPLLDDVADELVDLLRRHALEAARRAFDGIREADDRAFARLRARAGVAKALLAHLGQVFLAHVHDLSAGARILLLLQRAFVKIVNLRRAVVLLDDVDDLQIQPVLEREIHALFDMRDDDQRAHGRREFVVRVAVAPHVFGEIVGLHELADVVEIRAHPAHCGVGPDGLGRGLGEIRHHQAVVIRPRRLDGQALEQRVVQVAQLQPGDVRGDAEDALKNRQDQRGQQRRDHAAADGDRALPPDLPPVRPDRQLPKDRPHHPEHDRQQPGREPDENTRPEELRPAPHPQRDKDRDEPADQTHHQHHGIRVAVEDRAPQAGENRRIQPVVAPEQNRQHQRRKSQRQSQPPELRLLRRERRLASRDEHRFDQRQVQQENQTEQHQP